MSCVTRQGSSLTGYEFWAKNDKAPVKIEIDKQCKKGQLCFYRKLDLLVDLGVSLPQPHSKRIRGKLHALRVEWQKRSYRIFYYINDQQVAVLLHIIVKATKKLPEREIDTAERRMNEYLAR